MVGSPTRTLLSLRC